MNHELSPRDRHVLETLDQLTQLSTAHIYLLLFPSVSREIMDRCLRRLRGDRLIKRVGVRAAAHRGGTPPGVYTLTERGYWYLGQTNKKPRYTINEHTLSVADLFVRLVELDREGAVKLLPETSVEHSVDHMRVDLYLDAVLTSGKRRKRYVEVQRNARKDVISQKVNAHWNAYKTTTLERYPRVAFVVWDEYHAYLIKRLIPADKKDLFLVFMPDQFIDHAITP